ncbi:MAG: 3-isopropylmalate dehydratase small subunit [Candidatus Nanopelagicales bacterium]|nr:3-isopropylmalate dehydratase small subunit [Candidatus Nanopelagicales bacterium]MDZ4250874.1 3-isopropylmalate dehydratase small subunit [Candidatus Nanopelagicales bacterium]
MDEFTVHVGTGAPLRRSYVDTDQIIPAEYLKRITKTGFADGLFAAWRLDPDFVLNKPEFAAATILVAGSDFGTGSSREHAVWALQDYGFRVVISSRFADIFRGNAGKNGLLPAIVEADAVERLWQLIEADPLLEIEVDLDARTIRAGVGDPQRSGGEVIEFQVDADIRQRLLSGLDDIAATLELGASISEFESTRPEFMPTTTLAT